MEQGITEGKIRVITFKGAMSGRVAHEAAAFNNPPKVICEPNHGGAFNPSASLASFDTNSVAVSAVKSAYAGNGEK